MRRNGRTVGGGLPGARGQRRHVQADAALGGQRVKPGQLVLQGGCASQQEVDVRIRGLGEHGAVQARELPGKEAASEGRGRDLAQGGPDGAREQRGGGSWSDAATALILNWHPEPPTHPS